MCSAFSTDSLTTVPRLPRTGSMKLKTLRHPVPQDIEIAQSAQPVFIGDIASDLGLTADEVNLHGKTKAKVCV